MTDITEVVMLLAAPGVPAQAWHADALRAFLAFMVNVSPHPVAATQFVDSPSVDAGRGILGQGNKAARQALAAAWEVARRSDAPFISAPSLAPGDAIHTNPLHPHRSPAMPLQEETVECGRGKRRRAPPPPVTEGQLRRLIFLTYAKEVSAEGYPIFSEEEFVAGCEEALNKKKAKLQKKKP